MPKRKNVWTNTKKACKYLARVDERYNWVRQWRRIEFAFEIVLLLSKVLIKLIGKALFEQFYSNFVYIL